MRSPPALAFNDAIHRFLKRIPVSRYFTVSVCLHTVLLVVVGGMVLNRAVSTPPDFQAGAGGILVEEPDEPQPPATPPFATASDTSFTPLPPMLAPPLSALLTSSQMVPAWKVTMIPRAPVVGLSGSMKDNLASLGDRIARPAARRMASSGTAMGSTGGTRSAMIFGKRIVASRLGVILDVSVSGHSRLAGAITEIQNGFADATIILYPGCGMVQFGGASDCVIRPYSTISSQEIATDTGMFTTRNQLSQALTIDTFKKMTTRPAVKNTLFVAWYGGPGKENSKAKLIGQTQLAFEDLIRRGMDTIYWYADFVDAVDPRVLDLLSAQMQPRRVVLHVHNFAGLAIDPAVSDLAIKSGGTVNLEQTY